VEAGLDLLGDRSVSDLTVVDVCAKAGLSKRYFYEHFDSVDGLVDAVMEEAVAHLTDVVFGDRPSSVDLPRDRLASFVHAITADPRLARIVFVETFGSGSLARHRHRLVHQSVTLILEDFLAPEHSPISDDTARMLAAYSLAGATSELLVAWTEGEVDASADQLIDHLATLFERMAT
jgi:AcrR family transcriptional regulator